MPAIDRQTEQHLIDTAMKLFFSEGRINVTTQEIADAAGVNRTLINYYFRSKKALFNLVLKNAEKEHHERCDAILLSKLPFREKTEAFIDYHIEKMFRYPYMEVFITFDILQKRMKGNASGILPKKMKDDAMLLYMREIKAEMDAGRIPKTSPEHFMSNIFSLVIHPVIMQPLHILLFNVSDAEYQEMLQERKQVIMDILFPALRK
jgi:TetR/AcrR family transcriptional regulator